LHYIIQANPWLKSKCVFNREQPAQTSGSSRQTKQAKTKEKYLAIILSPSHDNGFNANLQSDFQKIWIEIKAVRKSINSSFVVKRGN